MDKIRILIDFDCTIVNSDICMADHYNNFMFKHPEHIEADGEKIYYYDARCQMPLYSKKDIMNVFDSDFFWRNLTIKEGAIETINKLCNDERFEVCIWSYGSLMNMSKKASFIENHLGHLVHEKKLDVILSNHVSVQKHEICKGAIIIDDHQDNLVNEMAFNICFTDMGERDFNKDFKGLKVCGWHEVESMIEYIYETLQFI